VRLIVASLFVLYLVFPQYVERTFYVNEVLSFIGMILAFNVRAELLHKRKELIGLFIIVFIFFVTSLTSVENMYIYVRNSVLIYSMFVYFVGLYSYQIIVKTKLSYLLLVPIDAVNYPVNLAIFFYKFGLKVTKSKYIVYSAILLSMGFLLNSSTSILIIIISSIYYIRWRKNLLIILIVTFLLIFYVLLYQVFLDVNSYSSIITMMQSRDIYNLDGNVTVRLVMWATVLFDILPNNLAGLSFGAQLFNIVSIEFLHLYSQIENDELLTFTLFPHNYFMYIIARLGVFSFVLFYFMYLFIFKNIGTNYKHSFLNFSVLSLIIVSSIHVVLGSPIHSGAFWGVIGLFHASRLGYAKN